MLTLLVRNTLVHDGELIDLQTLFQCLHVLLLVLSFIQVGEGCSVQRLHGQHLLYRINGYRSRSSGAILWWGSGELP